MFDAKSILDALVRGGGQSQTSQSDFSSISESLRQLAGADRSAPVGLPRQASPAPGAGDDGSGRVPQQPPPAAQEEDPDARQASPGVNLDDILRDVLGGKGGGLGEVLGKLGKGGSGGGLGDILGEILGQGASGGRAGVSRLSDAGGASQSIRNSLGRLTGRSPEELLAQLKEVVANNQLATGAALGGLGTLILGTRTGRSLAGSAVKLGGLAMIGALGYKALQNYQQGQRPDAGPPAGQALLAAPEGSGFEPAAVSNEHAMLLMRAMIAAAAADGRIDAQEQQKILGGLQQAGSAEAAHQFLSREIENPATIDELAEAVSSQEEAVQVYTAARIAVDPDAAEEHEFLVELAQRLGIDPTLAGHIDATARGAGT